MAEPLGQFMQKWGGSPPADPAAMALMKADQARIAQGKAPLTDDQTLVAMTAARNREPVVPIPEKNPLAIWSNITTDITDLVRGIPQLPGALINQASAALKDPSTLVRIPEGGNIADIGAVQFLPGAFTASALLPGGVPAGELATRPVTTTLDLLPFAQGAITRAASSSLRGIAPDLRMNSYQSARRMRQRLADTPTRGGIDANALSPWQKRAAQIAVASGEGKRIIPNLLTRRMYTDELGRGFIGDAHWVNRMRTNPMTRPLMRFSPTVRATMSRLRGDESMMVIEGRTTGVPRKARDWSNRFHDFYGDAELSQAKLEKLNNALTDPDLYGVRTPDEAIDIVAKQDPDLKPWYDEAKQLIEELTEQSFDSKWGEPVIRRYDGDNQIYTVAQHNRLTTSDQRLATAQKKLLERRSKSLTPVLGRLTKDLGGDVVEMIRSGDIDTARATLRSRGAKTIPSKIDAVQRYFNLERQVDYLTNSSLDDFVRTGPVNMQKFRYGRLSPDYLRADDWERLVRDVRAANARVQGRLNVRRTTRPGVESVTASRKIWERYQEMFKVARDEMPAKYGPDVWNKYKQEYRQIQQMDGSTTRNNAMRRLREELGDDARYLHYVVPDDAEWQNYTERFLRQNLAQQVSKPELDRLTMEVRRSLADMSANSPYEPAYLPRVPIEDAGKIDNTTIRASYMKPKHAKERSYDYAPMHPDLGVSVAYTSLMDHMSRRGIPYMVENFRENPALLTESYLNAMLTAEHSTLRSMGRTDLDPDPTRYINDAKNSPNAKRFVKFQPEQIFPTNTPTRTPLEQLWMPIEFESVVNSAVQDALSPSTFNKLLDPVTGLFRTSVLLFSPAWHYNNVLGNAMITAMTNPKALAQIGEQWRAMGGFQGIKKYVRESDAAESGLEASLRGQTGEFTPEMLRAGLPGILGAIEQVTMRVHKAAGKEFLESGLARSRTGIRLWDQARHSQAWEKMTGGIEKGASASLGFNSFFDDMARRANFQQFYDDAIKNLMDDHVAITGTRPVKGTQAFDDIYNEATRRALTQTQDWLMDWTQMLPFERSFLRAVFPFYSFAAHIMRAAIKFPFDHPVRVAVINAITNAEEEDWRSRYPAVFDQLLGWGDPDNQDQWIGLNVNSFNPFREVGQLLTLGGLLGASNPILQTMFEQFGINTMSGGPEYAPNFVYDESEISGTRYDAGNPLINLAKNLVPQAEAIAQMTGLDSGFRELQRSNPAAANRALLTGLRLPLIWKSLDVNQQVATDELRRYRDAKDAISQMDPAGVGRYFPQLEPVVAAQARNEEIRNATAGQLAQMVVQSGGGPPHNPLSNFITI